ncbi:hypothetical protein VTJ04DRAFT_6610 [Mycothermus thermophilus]|uniref:uncharacterized protein n=1 Tax=Humicola insolens TaxID=85995 RepID=UPI003741FB52
MCVPIPSLSSSQLEQTFGITPENAKPITRAPEDTPTADPKSIPSSPRRATHEVTSILRSIPTSNSKYITSNQPLRHHHQQVPCLPVSRPARPKPYYLTHPYLPYPRYLFPHARASVRASTTASIAHQATHCNHNEKNYAGREQHRAERNGPQPNLTA